MVKKYDKFEDYFTNKKQLKKYNNYYYLSPIKDNSEIIECTNQNHYCEFTGDFDRINNTTIIFKDSSFSKLFLDEFNNDNNNTIIFKNCTFKNAVINLASNSSVEFDCCDIENLTVLTAKNIKLNKIIYNVFSDFELGNKNTENITISGTKSLGFNIRINVKAKNINIDYCDLELKNCDTDNLTIENSNLNINCVNANNSITIDRSSINGKNNYIETKKLNSNLYSSFSNCVIQTNVMKINENTLVELENSILDISDALILKQNSTIQDNENKSFLIVPDVYLQKDSTIDLNQIKYNNDSEYWEELKLNDLYNEREKLVKTLKLVENKYNKPIKELR